MIQPKQSQPCCMCIWWWPYIISLLTLAEMTPPVCVNIIEPSCRQRFWVCAVLTLLRVVCYWLLAVSSTSTMAESSMALSPRCKRLMLLLLFSRRSVPVQRPAASSWWARMCSFFHLPHDGMRHGAAINQHFAFSWVTHARQFFTLYFEHIFSSCLQISLTTCLLACQVGRDCSSSPLNRRRVAQH